MLHPKWVPLVLVGAFLASRAASAQTSPSPVLTPAQLFEKASPSVVKIVAKDTDDLPIGTGSGFVIGAATRDAQSGVPYSMWWVVTNYHVVRSAVFATVDPPFAPARVKASERVIEKDGGSLIHVVVEDDRADLAVLAAYESDGPGLPLADDALPPVGTPVFVISSPEGLKNTLSEGLVSGYREFERGERWIQITAPVSEGSSGGPVLTADGKVIGVVVASRSEGQNLNFAVPVGVLRRLLVRPLVSRPLTHGKDIWREEIGGFMDALNDLSLRACGTGLRSIHISDDCLRKTSAMEESGDQLALLIKAERQYDRGSPDRCEALTTLKRAIQEKPGEYEHLAYYLLGKMLSPYSADPRGGYATGCRECVIQRDSATAEELRAKCYDPAIPLLKKSTQLNPTFSPSFASLVEVYLATERYPEALVAAEFLVALIPNCSEAYMLRGKAFAHLKRISAADEDFATAEKLRPSWFQLYGEVASTYSLVEERKAVDTATKGLSLPLPSDEKQLNWRQKQRSRLWFLAGINYDRLGDLDNAARAFEEYLRMARQADPQFDGPADIKDWLARYRAVRP